MEGRETPQWTPGKTLRTVRIFIYRNTIFPDRQTGRPSLTIEGRQGEADEPREKWERALSPRSP